MRRLGIVLSALTLFIMLAAAAFAHGNNDHVRGVVTQISADSVTVQLQDQTSSTLALTAKTSYEKSGKPVQLGDLKIGDRVVVDVPKGTKEALLVRFGPPPAKTAAKAADHHKK
jgi:hypothetical protein